MTAETRLWLIRHAPVDGPVGVIHAPDAPADLGNTSRLQALRAALPAPCAAYCSPARRTVETAAALRLDPITEPSFREQGFGRWTGRRHGEIEAELGRQAYQEFWRSPATSRPPEGESFTDQIARVEEGLARLSAGDVALIVHSGTIRAVLAIALEIPAASALRFVIDPLSLTRIDRLHGGWRVCSVNRA